MDNHNLFIRSDVQIDFYKVKTSSQATFKRWQCIFRRDQIEATMANNIEWIVSRCPKRVHQFWHIRANSGHRLSAEDRHTQRALFMPQHHFLAVPKSARKQIGRQHDFGRRQAFPAKMDNVRILRIQMRIVSSLGYRNFAISALDFPLSKTKTAFARLGIL